MNVFLNGIIGIKLRIILAYTNSYILQINNKQIQTKKYNDVFPLKSRIRRELSVFLNESSYLLKQKIKLIKKQKLILVCQQTE